MRPHKFSFFAKNPAFLKLDCGPARGSDAFYTRSLATLSHGDE